jgi:hypothetical protein
MDNFLSFIFSFHFESFSRFMSTDIFRGYLDVILSKFKMLKDKMSKLNLSKDKMSKLKLPKDKMSKLKLLEDKNQSLKC